MTRDRTAVAAQKQRQFQNEAKSSKMLKHHENRVKIGQHDATICGIERKYTPMDSESDCRRQIKGSRKSFMEKHSSDAKDAKHSWNRLKRMRRNVLNADQQLE